MSGGHAGLGTRRLKGANEVIRHQRFPFLTAFSGSLPPMSACDQEDQSENGTYDSGTVFFMIVSLPADAADTICCSIDLVTLALSAWDMGRRNDIHRVARQGEYYTLRIPACLMRAGFLGGSCRRPFFGAAAALAACLAFEEDGLACRPLVLPCAIVSMSMYAIGLASEISGRGGIIDLVPYLRRCPRCSLNLTSCALSARSSSSARYCTRFFSVNVCSLLWVLACAARRRHAAWPESGRLVWHARIQRRQRPRRHRLWMHWLPRQIPRL